MLSAYRWCTRYSFASTEHSFGPKDAVTARAPTLLPERRPPREPREPSRARAYFRAKQLSRDAGTLTTQDFGWHCKTHAPRGSKSLGTPLLPTQLPRAADAPRRHRRAHQQKRITRTTSILGLRGGAALLAREDLGRRAVLERRRVIGRRRREHVGHLRRPQREGRTSRRAYHG